MLRFMNGWRLLDFRRFCVAGGLFLMVAAGRLMGEPSAAAVSSFNSYASDVEARLGRQHRSQEDFLTVAAPDSESEARLRRGELVVEQVTPSAGDFSGSMLHHWRGTAFVPGGSVADFERLLRDFDAYPQRFAPEVVRGRVAARGDDHLQVEMRVRQKHVITVVMDATYDVRFGRLDARHGFSISRSMRISEIEAAGTDREQVLSSSEAHGFLWRLNTYWSYEERDGGLYVQIETVSLSRAIPAGLGWALRPYVESVPRESLEFTLRCAREALGKS
jgi:hypothetical protein